MSPTDSASNGVRFSPIIELGHILQACVMLAALAGWALYGYMTIDKQATVQANETALIKQRISTIESRMNELSEGLRTSAAENRASAGKISDQLADLRTLVAASAHK